MIARAALGCVSLSLAAFAQTESTHPLPRRHVYAPPVNPPHLLRETVPESLHAASRSATRAEKTPYDIGAPTDEEQLAVEFINRARADVTAEAPRLRDTDDPDVLDAYAYFSVDLDQFVSDMQDLPATLPPLAINKKLAQSARLHSQDMFDNAFQGHVSSPDPPAPNQHGDDIPTRATRQGYQYKWLGENVYSFAESVFHAHASFEVDWGYGPGGMQAPPGHRLSIHSANFSEIGVGIVEGTNTVDDVTVGPYVMTQDFGATQDPRILVTGVAYFDLDGDGFYDVGEGIGGLRVDVADSDYYAITADSGGYAVPTENGTRTVTFSGLGFSGTDIETTIGSGLNEKVDFTPTYQPPEVSGPAQPGIGTAATYTISGARGDTTLRAEIRQCSSGNWTEGAESAGQLLIDGTDDSYELQSTQVSASGARSLHLAHDSAYPVPTQTVTLDRTLLIAANSELQFSKRVGIANVDQKVEAQISTDGGQTWTNVWFQFGSIIGSGQTGETEFSSVAIPLPSYEGQTVRLRFRYLLEYNPDANPDGLTNWFNGTGTGYGVYLDNITVTNSRQLGVADTRDLGGADSFTFTPPDDNTYLMRAQAVNDADGNGTAHYFPWGPVHEVEAQPPFETVTLTVTGATPETVTFGMDPGATEDFDEDLDATTPAPAAGENGVHLTRGDPPETYQTDLIQTADRGEWLLTVQTGDETGLGISWPGSVSLPSGRQLLLFEATSSGRPVDDAPIDMTVQRSLTVGTGQIQHFLIFYGPTSECTIAFQPGTHGQLENGTPDVTLDLPCGITTPEPPNVQPNGGYSFSEWNPALPETLDEDVTATAQYQVRTYTISAGATTGGTITPSGDVELSHGANKTFLMRADDEYYLDDVIVDGESVGTPSIYSFQTVGEDHTIEARFATTTFTLTYLAGDHGTLAGETEQVVDQGTDGTPVEAVPDTGYSFVQWSDGGTDNPRTELNVASDLTVTASFTPNIYTITFQAGNHLSLEGGTPNVSVDAAHGTVFPTPPEVMPAAGWVFDGWDAEFPELVTGPLTTTAQCSIQCLWRCEFEVGNATPQALMIGMYDGGTNGPDADVDETIAAPQPSDAAVYFYRPQPEHYYAKDVIGTADSGEWFLTVQAGESAPVELDWSFPSALPEGRHFTLYQVDANQMPIGGSAIDMEAISSKTVAAGETAFFVLRYDNTLYADLVLGTEWNLISLPLSPAESAVEHIFDSERYVVSSSTRNGGAGNGVLYEGLVWTYDNAGYTAVTDLHARESAWIYINHAATLLVPGSASPCASVELPQGWHLLGVSVAGTVPALDGLTPTAWVWDSERQRYRHTNEMVPGLGHWIYATSPVTISPDAICNPR